MLAKGKGRRRTIVPTKPSEGVQPPTTLMKDQRIKGSSSRPYEKLGGKVDVKGATPMMGTRFEALRSEELGEKRVDKGEVAIITKEETSKPSASLIKLRGLKKATSFGLKHKIFIISHPLFFFLYLFFKPFIFFNMLLLNFLFVYFLSSK